MEGRAKHELTVMGYEVFLPLAKRTFLRRGREVTKTFPLFWTYAFIRFDPQVHRWQEIYSTRGVVGLVGPQVGDFDPPRPIPEREMALLRSRVESEGGAVSVDRKPVVLDAGTLVKIIFGPFQGLTGRVSADEGSRVEVLLRFVGAVRPLPFSKDFVEAV
jgi:transcriptional antiterminator RfaH